MKQDFSKYGKDFQENLTYLILTDRKFADRIGEVIQPHYFQYRYLETVISKFYKYHEKYNNYPTMSTVRTIIDTQLNKLSPALQSSASNFVKRCYENYRSIPDEQFVRDEAVKFCQHQVMKAAIFESHDLIEGSDDISQYDRVRDIINEALKLGSDNNYGHDYHEDADERFGEESREVVPTGWPRMNRSFGGGHGRGELGVIIAPTNVGKSFVLVHLGASALLQGFNVVHYTLELNERSVGNRYDACISGVSLNHVCTEKDAVLSKTNEVPGKLIIKQYPTKTATVGTLRNHINKLISVKGFVPDLVLVDYGDILKSAKHEAKRFGLEEIFEGLRALAMEFNVPVLDCNTNQSFWCKGRDHHDGKHQ